MITTPTLLLTQSLVALSLAIAPPSGKCPAAALTADQAAAARAHAVALREAETRATEDPEQGVALLTAALDRARADAAIVARDGDATEARQYAMLALARGLLGAEKRAEAAKILDIALATAAGDPLPSKLFGPSLVALHEERKAALDRTSTATLHARCTGACMVIVDAAWVTCGGPDATADVALPPGTWEVLLVDAADPTRTRAERVELTAGGSADLLLEIPKAPGTKRRVARPSGEGTVDDGGRKLPRWAGIVGMAVGVVALVAGGVLVAVDGSCPDGTNTSGAGACKNILDTDLPGYVMLGIGGGTLIGFTTAFGVGEAKQARARKANAAKAQVGLSPTGLSLRF